MFKDLFVAVPALVRLLYHSMMAALWSGINPKKKEKHDRKIEELKSM